jgi:hypothetical protein
MTVPAILFGLLLSTLYGAAFHFWRGGSLGKLLLYILLSWFGFWTGHGISSATKMSFGDVGPLHFGMATLGSIIFLAAGAWLSEFREVERK